MSQVNENRTGYKKTEIGWIPEDWKVKQLDDIGKWKGGGTPSKLNESYWQNGSIPWVSSQDMKSLEIRKTKYSITKQALQESSANLIPINSVLIVMRSGILRHHLPVATNPIPVSINQDIKALIPNNEINLIYLVNVLRLKSNTILKNCSKVGTTVESIEYPWLKTFNIPLPPLPEQKKIAEILSTWDETIEKLEKLIELKEQRKKGLMQQLLTGKKRLPGFGNPIKKDGELPEGWDKLKLSEFTNDITRKNTISCNHVLTASGKHGLVDQKLFFSKNVAGTNLSNYYLLYKGEFAYNRSAMTGYPYGAIKRLDLFDNGVLSTLYICFSLDSKKVNSDYLSEYFEAGLCNAELRSKVQVGARAHGLLNITKTDFYSLHVDIPPQHEQGVITSLISNINKELEFSRKEQEYYKTVKKGLMQKLLTGEVRVKIDERESWAR